MRIRHLILAAAALSLAMVAAPSAYAFDLRVEGDRCHLAATPTDATDVESLRARHETKVMDSLRRILPASTHADLEILRAYEGDSVEDPAIVDVSRRVDEVAVPLGFREREVASLINSVTSFRVIWLEDSPADWDRSGAQRLLAHSRDILDYERTLTRDAPGVAWWSDKALPIYWDTRELTIAALELDVAIYQGCVDGVDSSLRFHTPTAPSGSFRGSSS